MMSEDKIKEAFTAILDDKSKIEEYILRELELMPINTEEVKTVSIMSVQYCYEITAENDTDMKVFEGFSFWLLINGKYNFSDFSNYDCDNTDIYQKVDKIGMYIRSIIDNGEEYDISLE